MEKLKELREEIENIEIGYDYEESYHTLYNATINYMNDTQDWELDYLFNEIIDYELAEELARQELKNGGLIRLWYFLGDANLNNELFRIDGYGNLTDIDKSDLDYIKEQIIDYIDEKLQKESEVA